jgi:hypothetical protein
MDEGTVVDWSIAHGVGNKQAIAASFVVGGFRGIRLEIEFLFAAS